MYPRRIANQWQAYAFCRTHGTRKLWYDTLVNPEEEIPVSLGHRQLVPFDIIEYAPQLQDTSGMCDVPNCILLELGGDILPCLEYCGLSIIHGITKPWDSDLLSLYIVQAPRLYLLSPCTVVEIPLIIYIVSFLDQDLVSCLDGYMLFDVFMLVPVDLTCLIAHII